MRTLLYSLAALVLLGVGAVGGYFYGVTIGETRAVNIQTSFLQSRGLTPGAGGPAGAAGGAAAGGAAGGFGQGAQGGQAGGQSGAAGGFVQAGQGTIGAVRSVEGNVIEISTAQGAVRVTVTDETRIQETVQQAIPLTDLKPGANVVVQGDRDSTGNVTARAINLVPQGAGAFGQGGQRPGGQGGTPQAGQGGQGGQRFGGGGQGGQGGTPQPGATPAR